MPPGIIRWPASDVITYNFHHIEAFEVHHVVSETTCVWASVEDIFHDSHPFVAPLHNNNFERSLDQIPDCNKS